MTDNGIHLTAVSPEPVAGLQTPGSRLQTSRCGLVPRHNLFGIVGLLTSALHLRLTLDGGLDFDSRVEAVTILIHNYFFVHKYFHPIFYNMIIYFSLLQVFFGDMNPMGALGG